MMMKSIKRHIKIVAVNASFTFEELYTILLRIESILNSPSVISVSNEPND